MTVTARDPRQAALDQIALAAALKTNAAIQPQLAVAQVAALLYIGDAVNALREELRWATEHNQDRDENP